MTQTTRRPSLRQPSSTLPEDHEGLGGTCIYNGVNGNEAALVAILGRRIAAVAVGQIGYCRTGWNSGLKCDWKMGSTRKVGSTNASFCPNWPTCTDDLYASTEPCPPAATPAVRSTKAYNGRALIVGTIVGYLSSPFGNTSYAEKMGTVMVRWNLTQVCSGTCVVQ